MKKDLHLPDDLNRLKRRAQVVLPKDFGAVIALTGIGRNSKIAEAGSGSGFMAIQFARIAKKVYSYEIRAEHYSVALNNIDKLGIKNIVLKNDDIANISENNLDLIFLDMKDSDRLVEMMHGRIKNGGFLVGYCPNIEQAKSFHLKSQEIFSDAFTMTASNTFYAIRDFGCRPEQFGLMHTAYLVFAKK